MNDVELRAHRAIVMIDIELLSKALHLPEGTQIKHIRFGEFHDVMELHVVNQDLPMVPYAGAIPRITYSVTKINGVPDRYESKWTL